MIRNQWKYIVGILFLFFLSCSRTGEHEALFRQVESIVSDHPDSAMVLLQRIEEPERLDSADWARWALLTTQACDKAFIRHTTDSVINRVADYYQRFGDNHQKALAYYYHCCPINSINYKNVSLDHCVSVFEPYFVIPSPPLDNW